MHEYNPVPLSLIRSRYDIKELAVSIHFAEQIVPDEMTGSLPIITMKIHLNISVVDDLIERHACTFSRNSSLLVDAT